MKAFNTWKCSRNVWLGWGGGALHITYELIWVYKKYYWDIIVHYWRLIENFKVEVDVQKRVVNFGKNKMKGPPFAYKNNDMLVPNVKWVKVDLLLDWSYDGMSICHVSPSFHDVSSKGSDHHELHPMD